MIIGYERQMRYLERVIAGGRLAHAYLFHGPEHTGKETIACAVAKLLLCPHARARKCVLADADDGCAVCASIDAGTHQDVTFLGIDRTLVSDKEIRKEIPIEDIRELKRVFAYSARGAGWRIAILSDADKMSQEAADAFLKLLEEPGERTVFFLITSARERVSATIASRAIPMEFSLVPDMALAAYLKEYEVCKESEMPEMLAYVSGRPGIARQLACDPAEKKRMRGYGEAVAEVLRDGIPGALALAQKAAEDDAMRWHTVVSCITLLRARMHGALSPSERVRTARALARILDISTIMEMTNVNRRLALDTLFIQYASVAQ